MLQKDVRRCLKGNSLAMIYLLVAIHIVVCVFIIIVVLLQSGKSADVAAAFGGMGSQTAFGPRSAANVLTKATTWSAIIFMVTSIALSIMMGRRTSNSVLEGVKPPKQTSAPAQPGAPAKGSNQEPQPLTR
jgi:preprotein translocase subunit SecG